MSHKTAAYDREGAADALPFPAVTAPTLDEDRLWVGGPYDLLILEVPTRSVMRRCLMNNNTLVAECHPRQGTGQPFAKSALAGPD